MEQRDSLDAVWAGGMRGGKMTKADFWKQHEQCRRAGIAVKSDKKYSDVFMCTKLDGECRLIPCLRAHEGEE